MISIRGLRFQYKGAKRLALDTINLDIADGDFVGIIGTSGAGKSTLTYALNGIVPHHFTGDFYGQVLVDGMDTVDSSPEQLATKIGSVFQDIERADGRLAGGRRDGLRPGEFWRPAR